MACFARIRTSAASPGSASEKKTVRVAAEVTLEVRAVNDYLIIRPAQAGH
jgi:hypothetical protein